MKKLPSDPYYTADLLVFLIPIAVLGLIVAGVLMLGGC